jgi:cytidyltransferase-like protein
MKNKTIRVMVDMSATLIHYGHVRLLKGAREQFGTRNVTIVVGLTTDEDVQEYKGYQPELSFDQRKETLEAIRNVDEVVPTPWIITDEIMKKYRIDYLFHGSDNSNEIKNVVIIPRTKGVSSEELRERAVRSIVQKRNYEKPMFTPGPSNMSHHNMSDLRAVFGRGDDEYTIIEGIVLKNILKLTGHDKIVRLQGGGTSAIDIATSNFVLGKVLIVDAGYYSKRIEIMYKSKLSFLPDTIYKVIKYDEIVEELEINDKYDWIATAYAETADAFLCDIHLLKELADFKGAQLFLDATASINLEGKHDIADACSFSSCKGLGGLTGGAFITFKDGVYDRSRRGPLPFTMEFETHINKLFTGPYHAICSLFSISNNFHAIRGNVRKSKEIFLEKYKDCLVRENNEQPLISTIIRAKSVASNSGILYEPRTSPLGTAVICHLGDMFTDIDRLGDIYDRIIVEKQQDI